MTTIMTVCTGNICRSPAAELLLQHYLGDYAEVISTGTHAMTGHGIPGHMLTCLAGDGIDGERHRAAQFTAARARDADLILTATAVHRSWAVSEAPFALKRIFMIEEVAQAARLGAPLPGDSVGARLANMADAVQQFRPHLTTVRVRDVPDPYYGTQTDYDESYAMIREAVRDITTWVVGAAQPASKS